jgi:orotidine-5'-phosphate decarboxylase
MNFLDKLKKIFRKNNSLLCVGLDSELNKIPKNIKSKKNPQFEFNKKIIEQTHDLVCAYKPNIAFYEACGLDGLYDLKYTMDYLKNKHPDIPVIMDAKIADIGNTNIGYAKFIFEYFQGDAVTLHPFLGKEALKPFFEYKDKGIFILCRTSNPGAGEFQDLEVGRKPLYQVVASNISKGWNYNDNCGLVVGATYPTELKIVRHIVGDLPILIPGIGAQGADIEKTVKSGIDKNGINAIINSSRSIIFASSGENFAQKARFEAKKHKNEINKYR